jgi:ornithine cyclodeaminase
VREVNVDVTTAGLWLRFLSGPDIDSLGLSNAEIVAAVEEAVRAR